MPINRETDRFWPFKAARLLAIPSFILVMLAMGKEWYAAIVFASVVMFSASVLVTTFWPCPSCDRWFCTSFRKGSNQRVL